MAVILARLSFFSPLMLLQKLQKTLGEKHTNKNMPVLSSERKQSELNVPEYNSLIQIVVFLFLSLVLSKVP